MGIRREKVGSGLTETEKFIIEGELTPDEEAQLASMDAEHTLEGRLASIERECVSVLDSAGLPTTCGSFNYDRAGNWRPGPMMIGRLGWARGPYPIARQRGFAEDSKEGFAARMLSDIDDIRKAHARGAHNEVAMIMLFLGVKWSASGIKERHAAKSHPARRPGSLDRDVAMAVEFQNRRAAGTNLSDTALKADIGAPQKKPLKRSSAIEAVDRGLKFLSG